MSKPTGPCPTGLESRYERGIELWTDPGATDMGVGIAFSGRVGGVSEPPYVGLNLAEHVGDRAERVNHNRDTLFDVLGLASVRDRAVCAEQVHGAAIALVAEADAGSGAFAAQDPGPIPRTDALMTSTPGIPLMMFFADCVPVILVAPGSAVAVVHAGWRGALARLPGLTVLKMSEEWGCRPRDICAYVGPHISAQEYEVDARIMSQFVNSFGTVARAESGGLDLGAVVNVSLVDSGVDSCNILALGLCTAQSTDRLFSYRAEGGLTGRHAAIAYVLPR